MQCPGRHSILVTVVAYLLVLGGVVGWAIDLQPSQGDGNAMVYTLIPYPKPGQALSVMAAPKNQAPLQPIQSQILDLLNS